MNIFDFNLICQRTPLSICPALGINDPSCFARNISIGSWLIFQPGNLVAAVCSRLTEHTRSLFMHTATITVDISAIVMTMIMIYHIKSKYTAVGTTASASPYFAYIPRTEGNGHLLLLVSP
jgi:hypothetical protein